MLPGTISSARACARPGPALVAVAALAFSCPPASPSPVPDAPVPSNLTTSLAPVNDVERIEHPSGLTVLYQPNHASPVVAVQLWVRVGSADEEDAEAGLAHVHEHMLFKGTERRAVGQIARDIEGVGGSINAWTSFDQTVYHITIPSRFASDGLDVLLDAVANSTFDPVELGRELEVIQEEILRSEDLPARALSAALFETAYVSHPYGRPVIGTSASVARFTRDDVLRFYERWYRPENMTLVVVGDVERGLVDQAVEREFGDNRGAAVDRRVRPQEPEQSALRVTTVGRDVQEAQLAVAFHAPDLASPDTPALELLAILLGQGESSVLFENVQRRLRLTNDVYAYLYSPAEPGLFTLGATFPPDTPPEDVLEAIIEEIAEVRHREIPATDIRRAQTIVESDAVFQRQTVQGIAQRIGYFHTVAGDVDFERHFNELARRVGPDDLRDVARRYFRAENMTVAALVPEDDAGPALAQRLEQTIRDTYRRVDDEVDSFALSPDDRGVVRYAFDNGLVAIVQHDPTAPMFSMRASVMGGVVAEDPSTNGAGNLISSLLTAGTESRSASALALETEALAASLSGFSGRNTIGLRMSALSRDFETAVELFADALLHSTFPDDELLRLRRETLSEINAQRDNLAGTAFRLFNERAYAGHPYAMPVIGTEDSVGQLDRAELVEIYHRLVQPSRMVISIVGDVDPDRALRALARLFRDTAPAADRILPPRDSPTRVEAALAVGEPRDRQQVHVVMGFQTEPVDGPHRYALDVLGAVLGGQGGRLFVELRDRLSLAYSVGAFSNPGLDAGTFAFYIATSPQKLDQAIDALRAEIQRVAEEGIEPEELERAKRYLVGNRDISLQRHSTRAGYFTFDELFGRGYDHGYDYDERVGAVTEESVLGAVRTYLAPDRAIIATVGPGASE